jgi:hypothetical protein
MQQLSTALVIAVVVAFAACSLYAADNKTETSAVKDTASVEAAPQKMDVVTNALMSGFIPGLGQIFCGNYASGILFMGLEAGVGYYGVKSYLDMTEYLKHPSNEYPAEGGTNYGELVQHAKSTAITMGILLVGLHVGNVMDAVKTTKDYNSRIDSGVTGKTASISYTTKF